MSNSEGRCALFTDKDAPVTPANEGNVIQDNIISPGPVSENPGTGRQRQEREPRPIPLFLLVKTANYGQLARHAWLVGTVGTVASTVGTTFGHTLE